MPDNNWYKGYCFTTHLTKMPYTHKRKWEAHWQVESHVKTIARSDISLKDLRVKARIFFDKMEATKQP